MKRNRALKWGVVVFVSLVGALVLGLELHRYPHLPRRILQTVFGREYVPGPDIQFRWAMSGSGIRANGSDFESDAYESSDGVRVDKTLYRFSSTSDAEAEFGQRVKSDYRVIANREEKDSLGVVVFQRAVTRISKSGQFFILRRKGDRLLVIDSPSLNHALAYEEKLGLH
jgi:hypothetical protein